jgi:tripartite motif-containing protein 71
VFVVDSGNQRIQVFRRDGTFVRKWGRRGSSDGEFRLPFFVACGVDKLVYVTDVQNNCVQVFKLDGTFQRKWARKGSGDGEFNSPLGVCCGDDGLVYVADSLNKRIQVFRPDGTFVRVMACEGMNLSYPRGLAVGPGGRLFVSDECSVHVIPL